MKNSVFKGMGALILVSILFACGKGGTDINDDGTSGGPHVVVPTDTTRPALTINNPVADQVFRNGEVINVAGIITDDYALYRGYVKITNDANGSSVFYQAYEIHGLLSYNFNLNHTVSVPMNTNYTVTVSFEDHGLNSVTKTVKIKANP